MEFSILFYNKPMEFLCFDIKYYEIFSVQLFTFFPDSSKSKLRMNHVYSVALSSPWSLASI